MQSIIQRFLGFDRLLGPVLVKIVYYVGAAGIVIMAGIGLLTGVLALAGGNLGQALMQILAVPVVGAVVLVYWRFLCELFMLAFLAYERLGQVRDAIVNATGAAAPSAPDPNHPTF
jgi:nitrate/nitrite transporter NarK